MISKQRKIGIIGVGHVGSLVADSLVIQGVCDELILIDKNTQKAQCQALDLADALPYLSHDIKIYSGNYSNLSDADIVVISACSEFADEDRLKELDGTLEVMDDIIPQLIACGFSGIVISISNPCDLIAQYIHTKTDLNVIGTGTMLDSARMRLRTARALGVTPHSVQGYVLGEHGDSQMVAWSSVTVSGIPLEDWQQAHSTLDLDSLAASTTRAGWDIVIGKNCTEFGIGSAATALIKAIFHDEKRVLPCSTFVDAYDIYTSVPCIIGCNGVESLLPIYLTDSERELFEKSCTTLQSYLPRLER